MNSIRKKFILLLSATPVQNDLSELYNIIALLKPGTFPPEKEFLKIYCDPKNPRAPKNASQLRFLMCECMIRNTRAGCGVPFPRRIAATYLIQFTNQEKAIYDRISDIAYRLSGAVSFRLRLLIRTLLERSGAHPPLALNSLRTLGNFLRNDKTVEALDNRDQIAIQI